MKESIMRGSITITSTHNRKVKSWVQLKERKHRYREKLFIVEGIRLVQEALCSGAKVEVVAYNIDTGIPEELIPYFQHKAGAAFVHSQATQWIAVTDAIICKCSDTVTPQSVFAIVNKSTASIEHLLAAPNSLVVVINGVQNPGNLGTIIRTADAVGADGIVIGKNTVDLYDAKTVRSTMGSLFHLPIVEGDLLELLPLAQASGIRLTSTSLQAKHSCYSYDYRPATWLIVGNEGQGVSQHIQSLVNDTIMIPMRGQAESLNVAMATTVLLYEAMRQRYYY